MICNLLHCNLTEAAIAASYFIFYLAITKYDIK
nr:MAG TPA: hypothetical protein [Caudoviricetes sp.]DAO31499.1 MAG TPA: hypothetical protein [Caudoviricetes sp.]DAT73754.1 MAG TPA: hypothetical protein [Caudoviricetes sp.]